MSSILYFALWALFIFVMMRFGCGAHIMGRGHGHRHDEGDETSTPAKAVDPVCGMKVETAKAKSSAFAGRVYYFCSQNCREKFEAAPESYTKGSQASPTPMEAHHGTH